MTKLGQIINVTNQNRLFGFLLGVTLAGLSAYYYVIDEYKLANDMLTEDIYVRQLSDSQPRH